MSYLNNLPSRMAVLLMLGITLCFTNCKKDDDNGTTNNGSNKAQVNVRLTDGPADYDAIWLDIKAVEVITDEYGSTQVNLAHPGLYNILSLNNGIDTLLVSAPMPVGTISQIRLLLGNNNSIVVNGQSHSLNTPSAQESGLKLNIHQTLSAGLAYTIWLDFDAAKSILQTGNGQYKLKPVIRAYTALTDGRIEGYVLPLASLTTVYAINGVDTFSAIPMANGYFRISGLPAGSYQVFYEADAMGFLDVTLPNVQVSYGVTTDIGIRTMTP